MKYDDDDECMQSLLETDENRPPIDDILYHRHNQHRNRLEFGRMASLISCFVIIFIVISVTFAFKYELNNKDEDDNKSGNATEWTYRCENKECIRKLLDVDEPPNTLESCNMFCNLPDLWPKPKSVHVTNHSVSSFRKNLIIFKIKSPKSVNLDIKQAIKIFLSNIETENTSQDIELDQVVVNINVTAEDSILKLNTDESYKLSVLKTSNSVLANVTAQTYFGARHGLETLSQLIWLDSISKNLQIYHGVEIEDKPSFPHRGLMVDTARNFFPISELLKVINGMAANKLNVFHLHLTDSMSFPIILPSNPWLAQYGAYGPNKTYTPEDIKGMVEYARIRGIRVVLEIDSPSHVNEGWNHANQNNDRIIICGETDVNNGHLNPDNNRTFKLLETIYSDLLDLGTDREIFHVGGDEVNLDCLRETNAAQQYTNIYNFWADFNNKIFKTVTKAFKNNSPENIVMWSNDLTSRYIEYLKYSRNLVVQYWYGDLEPILNNGNKVIFSTVGQWYLDCGFGPWKMSDYHGACDPYTHWKVVYTYRPWDTYKHYRQQVMGGEACLWSEQVDVSSLETRIWPRTSALAERLWSDMPVFDQYDVATRISSQRDRMIRRGFKAAAVWPEWCTLHPGKC